MHRQQQLDGCPQQQQQGQQQGHTMAWQLVVAGVVAISMALGDTMDLGPLTK